ncbi:butyrophilin subfamily 3 member A2-like [Centropristis striata]|uniref:butyrophilin subfamily 3 member A2-like n=1 Tax=Centropristis striata TaxID=184440 RepID=UPI0027E13AE7|nr:butyrophilin subfamily 3 member A2-like [Centropristis striata]
MVPTNDRLLRSLRTASVFQRIAVFLLLTHLPNGGQSLDNHLTQTVMVMVGDDVVLPCQLEPSMNAVTMTIEWGRPDLKPRFVFVWHNGKELLNEQNKAYKGRASLSISNMKHGDISLKLSPVKNSDHGTYRCYIPKLSQEYFVELLVGAVSSPAISLAGIDETSSGVMLDCESSGWYPEPEVLWLDGEGKLLSAGPTETVRGPDDLYTVSSRVTVEKRHSNSFTCRVHQKNTNHTREAHITLTEDFFMASCSGCAASTTISVLFAIMFVLAVGCIVWKWRQNKSGVIKSTEQQSLMEAEVIRGEQLKAENEKMKAELQQKETDKTQVIDIVKGLMKEMVNQNNKVTEQKEKAEKLLEENREKVQSVEKEVAKEEGDVTLKKAKAYRELKETLIQNNWNLEERKTEFEELQINTEKLMKKAHDEVNRITEEIGKERDEQLQDTEFFFKGGNASHAGGRDERTSMVTTLEIQRDQMDNTLKEVKTEVEGQRNQLKGQLKEMEEEREEIKNKLQSVEKTRGFDKSD